MSDTRPYPHHAETARTDAMQFPYGLSDFSTLIEEGYWYLDRTDRIARIEGIWRRWPS